MDWATLGLYCIYFIAVLVYALILYLAVDDLAACFQHWRRRRRSRGAAERLLDSVRDVPYLPPLPDQHASSSSCVICMVEYARGEGRFVMPVCSHAFHRVCVAQWLRQAKTTCPICRAIAVVVVGPPAAAAGEEGVAVGGVSTAEDMV